MSNQSLRQAAVREATGTALTYEGDWHALFDDAGIAAGTYNERLLLWINAQLGSSYTDLPGAMQAFAEDQGFDNWSSMGTFTASAPLIPLYSTVTFFGDGVMSEAAAAGLRNAPLQFMARMNGRLRPSAHMMKTKSGGDLDTIYARIQDALDTLPDIFVFTSQGHNDGIMSSGYAALMVKWERNLDYCVDNLPSDTVIVVGTTIKSNVAGETSGGDWQTTVNTAQRAKIAALQATHGSRIIEWDSYAVYDPDTMAPASDATGTHPDERGGWAMGGVQLYDIMDPLVVAATKIEILEDREAKAWRSACFGPDHDLTGTGGTKSGTVAPTGNVADGQRVTNNLTNGTSVAVTCSKDTAGSPTYEEQIAEVSGTPAATNTVRFDDTASFAFTGAVPGAFMAFRCGVTIDDGAGSAPTGVQAIGTVLGSIGTFGTSGDPGTGQTAPIAHVYDGVLEAMGAVFGADSGFSTNPQLNIRFDDIALDARIRFSHPDAYQVELEEYGPMRYVSGDGIAPANEVLRVTGTGVNMTTMQITAATVGTVRLETGRWAGGNEDWSTAFTRVLKINDVVVGGALAATWAHNLAGAVSGGDTVAFELTGENGIGGETQTLTFTVV